MNKTIVNIERISDCFPELKIAKSGFYNFESGAFNHSATLPFCGGQTRAALNHEIHYARIRGRGKPLLKFIRVHPHRLWFNLRRNYGFQKTGRTLPRLCGQQKGGEHRHPRRA
jgi:hypothetical protein